MICPVCKKPIDLDIKPAKGGKVAVYHDGCRPMGEHEFGIADLTWSAVKSTTPLYVIVYEDGPQPRDSKGRFRKRRVVHLEPENGTNSGQSQ